MTKVNGFITGPAGAWLNSALLSIVIFASVRLYDKVDKGFDKVDALEIHTAVLEWRTEQLEKKAQ